MRGRWACVYSLRGPRCPNCFLHPSRSPPPRARADGLWLQFKSLCLLSTTVAGVDRDTFRRFVPSLMLEDAAFVERVFTVLDRSGSAVVTWVEFIECLSCLGPGPLAQRAAFLFRCYDRGSGGELSAEDLFHFFSSSSGVEVPPGWDGPTALAAARAGAAAAAEHAARQVGYEPGEEEGVALLETIEDPREALLLTMYEMSVRTFELLDVEGRGSVTLASATAFLEGRRAEQGGRALNPAELGAVFGRCMITATESDISATVLAGFAREKDAQLTARIAAARAHKSEIGQLLDTVRSAELRASASARAQPTRRG